jgi:methionyl aminopeptidase
MVHSTTPNNISTNTTTTNNNNKPIITSRRRRPPLPKYPSSPYPSPISTVLSLPSTIRSKPPYAINGWAPNSWDTSFAKFDLHGLEIKHIRKSCQLAAQALQLAGEMIYPGISTETINNKIHHFFISHGAYPSPLNYHGFPKSICTSLNEVLCHGIPNEQLHAEKGDLLKIDVSCYLNGFHGDTCATFAVGGESALDDNALRLMKITKRALMECIDLCKPGVPFQAIGKHVHHICEEEKLTSDRNFAGHGIGHIFHMRPLIHHVINVDSFDEKGEMEPGMVFTIEPILMESESNEVDKWPDLWTVSTSDGTWAAQFEHTILITENGSEILTIP